MNKNDKNTNHAVATKFFSSIRFSIKFKNLTTVNEEMLPTSIDFQCKNSINSCKIDQVK